MAEYQYYDLSSGGEDDFEAMPTVTYSLGSCVLEDPEESYLEDERWVPKPLYVQAQVNADEDDDWNSDPEVCAPVQLSPPAVSAVEMSGRKPFMDYEDDVWVDEAKGTFNTHKTSDLTKVTELLREMFDVHDDVYTLLLAFLNRTGKVRMQKKSLPRIVITEFQAWLGEQQEKPKNAILTAKHRKEALQVLTKCHSVLMDDLTAIFELHSAEKTSQLDLIDSLLVQDRLKEAVTYTWKFGLQEHFEMRTMLLPLVALDKINLIENYIDGSRKLQEEFVGILDDLCEPGTTQAKINSFLSTCTLGPKSMDRDVLSKGNCKLNFKQLYRLAHRMVSKYSLDLSKFSHIHSRWSDGALHHLLHMRYVEGTITEDNIDDLLETFVEDNKSLQLQLVKELFHFNDTSAAVKWAVKCNLPVDQLPYAVQVHLDTQSPPGKEDKTPSKKKRGKSKSSAPKQEQPIKAEFFEFSLPLSSVVFVDQKTRLDSCWDAIKKANIVIGIDAEWKLPSCNRGIERLAVLQLAVEEAVYLLDMVHLPRVVGESVLRDFMITLLHSEHSLKLGYGIQCDLHMLSKSWPFIGDILGTPVQVLDLQKLEKMVEELKKPTPLLVSAKTSLPVHPLLRNYTKMVSNKHHFDDRICDSKVPVQHPPLIQNSSKPSESQTSTQNGGESVRGDPYGVAVRRGGLAKLVEMCFGKPLDKSQQLSDWEKRPLTPEQITYAALDAHCLLGVYKYLMAEAVTYDLSFSLKPALLS